MRWQALFIVFVLALARRATAQDDEPVGEMRSPERLTAGVSNQLLGQISPDGKTLYFVSDRNTTHELFAQSIADSRSHMAFDEDAEITWPRVSPDGKRLLYISFRDRATGQLCVRDLPDGGSRRCLEDSVSAIQAEWIDKGRILLVARTSIEGDLHVLEVTAGSHLAMRSLFDRNLMTPAVSPDGRWLVYVPIARYAEKVGPVFAARAGERLEAVGLEHPGTPVSLAIDLPGQVGQPVFSHDGRYLYFAQFFSDSNHDGVVDANDHGVLFRAPITLGTASQIGTPEQLTDTSWNCQYPAPTPKELVATCTHAQSLDVYSLPLDGQVPSDWDGARLRQEIAFSTRRAEQQILYHRRLAQETTTTARRLVMANLVRLHLDLDEFRAAGFYAEHVAALHDHATAGISSPLVALVAQRRAVRERERGRLADDFHEQARTRLDGLRDEPSDSAAAVALKHIVRSEIADTTGDKTRAKTELAQTVIDEATPHAVLLFYYERADALYRELDDRASLALACVRLSTLKSLAPDVQLEYARAAVRAMVRGLSFDDADAALVGARKATANDSELAFAIDLGRGVLGIRDDHPPDAVNDALVDLFVAQKRADRRRVIVFDAVKQAARVGAERLIELLAVRWLDHVSPGTEERPRAERLFRRALTNRAYRRAAQGRVDEARADFDSVAHKTGSLESAIGSIDLRLQGGTPRDTIRADYDAHAASYTRPVVELAKTYLITSELPTLEGRAFDDAVTRAQDTVRASWAELATKRAVRAILGALLHQRFLRSGDLALAERATVHDLVALDLVGTNPRYRAMILDNLGLLQTSVGNYHIALAYLKLRDALPYVDDAPSLATRMAHARSLFHVGREDEAAKVADDAFAMATRTPALAPYRILALDRAALYNFAAAHFDRALALYDQELPLIEVGPARGANAKRNRFVLRLVHAAAALGAGQPQRTLDDLVALEPRLRETSFTENLQQPHTSREQVVESYRLITTGLRARASRALGDLEGEHRSLEARRAVLMERIARGKRVEDLYTVSLVESQLADSAAARQDSTTAAKWVDAALTHANDAHAQSNGAISRAELDVVWLASQLELLRAVTLTPAAKKTLEQARVDTTNVPRFRLYARWFELGAALAP